MINYTFIIPHKNTPDLLQKCLESIPRREDVQIIVIDDNSDPRIVDFTRFPGAEDPTVHVVYSKEGKGAGFARNIGLKIAIGRWLLFADADDFYTPALSGFLDKYANADADVIFWKTTGISTETGMQCNRGIEVNTFTQEAIETGNFDNILMLSVPWKGMYSHRLITEEGIKFNECMWGNDVVFSSKVALSANTTIACNDVIYCVSFHTAFGLTANPSTKSLLTRFNENSIATRLLNSRYKHNTNLHSWYFNVWFALYKSNKKIGILAIPKAIITDGGRFILECAKAKFVY